MLLKSPKLPGANFSAARQFDPRSSIDIASIALARSHVSLSSGDEVPHILTRNSRPRSGEFLITSAKRLFQQHRSKPEYLPNARMSASTSCGQAAPFALFCHVPPKPAMVPFRMLAKVM